jgi:hypothetical protein
MPYLFLQILLVIGFLPPVPRVEGTRSALQAAATISGSHPAYAILVPTGESAHGFPVLKYMPQDDPRMKTLDILFKRTFIAEMVRVNQYVRQYLLNKKIISHPEPAYLLISGRQGGFPMKGFYLSDQGKLTDKTAVPFVELAEAEENYQTLSSITQIYPHALAHIFYEQLARVDPANVESYSPDVHYFSLVTDYFKAFNEGYAESFENLSRALEPDSSVRRGIRMSVAKYDRTLPPRISGFNRDFRWPARIGFYRLSMVIWYQQLENYKRYIWAGDGRAKYRSASFSSADLEKALQYRNACVIPDGTSLRNAAQAASTEGVVSSFFTKLRESNLKEHFADRSFYLPFFSDTAALIVPRNRLTPEENQLLKEFYVICKYLGNVAPGRSPLFGFINGYLAEFPDERQTVLRIFRDVTGAEFPGRQPTELWVLNPGHAHHSWIMAQFGGTAVPYYTFNLNTADWMDLATLKGVSPHDARLITAYRDSAGYFSDFYGLQKIRGLEPGTAGRILGSRLTPATLKAVPSEDINMLTGLLRGILSRLLFAALAISVLTGLILYLLYARENTGWKRLSGLWIRTFFKTLLFLVVCLVPFVLQMNPFSIFIPFILLMLAINFFCTRGRPDKRNVVFSSTLLIAAIVCYSLA